MFKSLSIESLTFSYTDHETILNGIYLKALCSDIIGIVGRNGSGKSTLFNAITITGNYLGSIFINDKYISKRDFAKIVSYLPQVPFTPNDRTVKYVINMFPIAHDKKKDILRNERISYLLNQKVSELSGGERRYFEFLLINSTNCPIIILDEPFSEIEPIYEEVICNHIKQENTNRLYIISDHKYTKVKEICTKLYLLKYGSLIKISSDKDLVDYGYLAKE